MGIQGVQFLPAELVTGRDAVGGVAAPCKMVKAARGNPVGRRCGHGR